MKILKGILLALWLFPTTSTWAEMETGNGAYLFEGWAGPPLRVFYTQPAELTTDRPIVFVMHGMSRTAREYRDQWHDLALERNFLLIVPEFTRESFPGSRSYNLGNLKTEADDAVPREKWSFTAPLELFTDVRVRFGMDAERFALYGHSAGSQFVHRFLMHYPDAPVTRVVAANAGWYSMPDFNIDFPYGLANSQVDEAALVKILKMPITILLGDADTLTDQANLNQSPEALLQGPHRYARGHQFFEQGQQVAERLNVPFNWQLVTVPGADHDNAKMAPVAVNYLLTD